MNPLMSEPCRIELLGGLRATLVGRVIMRFPTYKTAALLGSLAYHPNPQSREHLIEMFWPEISPERGRNNLSTSLSSLRSQLEPPGVPAGAVIIADRHQVRLNPSGVHTDVQAFEQALHLAASAQEDMQRAEHLQIAVDLYKGELLPGYYEDWIYTERQRLAEAYLQALRRLIRFLFKNKQLDQAIDYSLRILAIEPLREEARRDLMKLYVAVGEPSAALQQYRELEAILQRDLNAKPSSATRQVFQEIEALLQQPAVPATLALSNSSQFARAPHSQPLAEAGVTSTLPMTFTRFFGRALEQARLQEWLLDAQTRLVTMTGIGGAGKTRLALEVARSLEDAFGRAVWFVALADLVEAKLIVPTMANALRLPHPLQSDPMDQVVAALTRRSSLLILDNFEQLVAEGAPLVRELLKRVPNLTVLVTSRQTLGLEGEREFALAPLAVPGGVDTPEQLCLYESVQLFLDRAQEIKPDFQVTGQNAAAVATLCDRLEGIPLAIELAAARVQVLTPLQILAQLENRFDFLTSRRRDISERHRTLRATMEWSYRLLSSELQQFFACLSVFRGGWTTEAAEAVCEEPLALDYLAQLREGSLVLAEEREETMRFRMLETVREYAAEMLAEADRSGVRRQYTEYFIAFTEDAASKLNGTEQALWFERLETEHDNIRAVLHWSLESPPELGLRLSGALQRFWQVRGYLSEGRAWMTEFLAQLPGQTPERAEALHRAGLLAYHQTDYGAARSLGEESLSIFRLLGDKRGIARVLNDLGLVSQEEGDSAREQAYFEEMLATWRDIGDQWRISMSLINLGNRAEGRGDNRQARAYYAESIGISREMRYRQALSFGLKCLAGIARREHAYDEANQLYDEALQIFREEGNQHHIAWILLHKGTLATEQGDFVRAPIYLVQALSLHQERGDLAEIASALDAFAGLAIAQNKRERAITLWGAAEKLRTEVQMPLTPSEQQAQAQAVFGVHTLLGDQAFTAVWAAGQLMTSEQAIAYALSETDTSNNHSD